MKKIVLASNNNHKIKEINEMLSDYEVLSLKDIGFFDDIEETGSTLEENSFIKANAIHEYLKEKGELLDVIADDTGLCCIGINLAPGVYSARYGGDHDDQANRDKLLKELIGKNRDAYFACSITLIRADGSSENVTGKCMGHIMEEETGDTSFCYDCLFYSDELEKTFGEATEEEKNSVSHRAKAIELIKKYL